MIFNLGSINADYFYDLPRLVKPGETLSAKGFASGLGGKGANQSVAAALAGAEVRHIGAVGSDGDWAVQCLRDFGVDVRHVRHSDLPTAHAIVMVDGHGENQIVVYPGANMDQSTDAIAQALGDGRPGDWLILQNETSHQVEAAALARRIGMHVAYSAAPFEVDAIQKMIPHATILIMNSVEAQQFKGATGAEIKSLAADHVLITRGGDGADLHALREGRTVSVPAFAVETVDTTGAGDTFTGYLIAGLSQGKSAELALRFASAAAALSTTKKGTADAIPDLAEVRDFLSSQDANGALDPQS
ncbi:MAG: ribokinase [Pseudomonadota bacterium]